MSEFIGPFVKDGESLKDSKGRMVMTQKSKGWVFSRYPDMTEIEKQCLLDIRDVIFHGNGGEALEFTGESLTREGFKDYLDFNDDKKGDLCG
jgi:hypothetical protein